MNEPLEVYGTLLIPRPHFTEAEILRLISSPESRTELDQDHLDICPICSVWLDRSKAQLNMKKQLHGTLEG